jgi:hypothetical protein
MNTEMKRITTHDAGERFNVYPLRMHDGTICHDSQEHDAWQARNQRKTTGDSVPRRVQVRDALLADGKVYRNFRDLSEGRTVDAATAATDGAHAADAGPIEVVDDITQRPDILLGDLDARQPLKRSTEPTIGTDAEGIETVDLASRPDICVGGLAGERK